VKVIRQIRQDYTVSDFDLGRIMEEVKETEPSARLVKVGGNARTAYWNIVVAGEECPT